MRISVIGSGNVATHLSAALKNAGHRIVQVYSPDKQHAALLAYHVKAQAISNPADINPETDLFIIAVNDDSILKVAKLLAPFNKPVVHTSGATSLQQLSALTPLAGVFYPLQTFSKTIEVDFWTVPLCIEAVDSQLTAFLKELAETISNNVNLINSYQRKVLHLAAVFACNFPNFLYYTAGKILAQNDLDYNLLRPLIAETAKKVQTHLPQDVQTGPAIRNDMQTMEAHLQLLSNKPDLQQLYMLLSQHIIKMEVGGKEDK